MNALLDTPIHTAQKYTTQQLSTFDRSINKKTKALRSGESISIGEVKGCGFIANIWMTMPNWFWGHWAPQTEVHQSLLKTVILKIYWDGAEKPAVEAPIGDFFGVGLCRVANFASHYFGMSSGGFFCKFPMPFREGFRIEIENKDENADTEIFLNAVYQLDEAVVEQTPSYFHAQFNTDIKAGTDPMPIANFTGTGKYLGCTLSMQSEEKCYLRYLEAPEFIYVDDDWDEARIIGTGLEDYFLGGWYFREGCFHGPLHGVAVKDVIHAAVAMYRIHDQDAIYFNKRMRMHFHNLWELDDLKPYAYSSVAFAMLNSAEGQNPKLPETKDLLCWYRVRDIDHSWDGQ